jgi:hypothetical protein
MLTESMGKILTAWMGKVLDIYTCGICKVRLPNRREELTLVVVKGFGEEPMMILTNLSVRRTRKSVWHVVQSYITRWRIEDVIRFVKQSYRPEDIRCLTYHRLQALIVLVTVAAYFTAVYLGLRMKLRVLATMCSEPRNESSASPTSGSMPWPTGSVNISTVRPKD